jgi:hypothetical protein
MNTAHRAAERSPCRRHDDHDSADLNALLISDETTKNTTTESARWRVRCSLCQSQGALTGDNLPGSELGGSGRGSRHRGSPDSRTDSSTVKAAWADTGMSAHLGSGGEPWTMRAVFVSRNSHARQLRSGFAVGSVVMHVARRT